VVCEDGKININEIFDFKKQEFKKEYEPLIKGLEIPKKFAQGEIHTKLVEFLKKRKRKIDDISELTAIDGFGQLDLFYHPPLSPAKGQNAEPNRDLALYDVFTTWTSDDKLNLLWLSDALCAILTLRRPLADDAQRKQEGYQQFIGQVKPEFARDWDAHWKYLELIYEHKPSFISSLKNIFSKEFEPKVYSVLSYGKVGHVEQKLLAVIKQVKEELPTDAKPSEEEEEKKLSKDKDKKSSKEKKKFKVLRLYWI
jgi:hypothetical protein